jgi:hypothetical protein
MSERISSEERNKSIVADVRTFKASFWNLRTGEKRIEMVTAEDKVAALSIANAIFAEEFECRGGYLFAAFNEVFGTRHIRPPRQRERRV